MAKMEAKDCSGSKNFYSIVDTISIYKIILHS